jgi:hypothetical protein
MSKSGNVLIPVLTGILLVTVVAVGAYIYKNGQHTSSTPVPTAKTPSTTIANATSSDECVTADLSASLAGSVGGGAAGTQYYDLILTNTSSRTCLLYAFPGVALLGTQGNLLGTAQRVNLDGTSAASQVSLAPGQSGYFALGVPNAGNFPAGTCTSGVASLQIYPPDQTIARIIPNVETYVGNIYCPGLAVSAVSATKL